MSTEVFTFGFLPRYRTLAICTIGLGFALAVWGFIAEVSPAIFGGVFGIGLGAMYLLSPAWRMKIVVSPEALTVMRGQIQKIHSRFSEVEELVVSEQTSSCYLRGQSAATSFLVPGLGAPAPYEISQKTLLVKLLIERVPPAKHVRVARLDLSSQKPMPTVETQE